MEIYTEQKRKVQSRKPEGNPVAKGGTGLAAGETGSIHAFVMGLLPVKQSQAQATEINFAVYHPPGPGQTDRPSRHIMRLSSRLLLKER